MQGSYIDVHDNENVYLSVDKARVSVGDNAAISNEQAKTESVFAHAVVDASKTEAVIAELRRLMEGKTKPKDVLEPVRAAIEAGVIRRPTWEEFASEFAGMVRSKASFSDYTNPGRVPYEGADFDVMTEAFRQL